MGPFSFLRGASFLALAAGLAPFVFFGLVIVAMLGLASVTFAPLLFAFLGWMSLNRWARRAEARRAKEDVIEARVVPEASPAYAPEAYSPPVHFDLLLDASRDIGRILGASVAMEDGAIARQFRTLAERAEAVLSLIIKEPAKLGLARRFFASHLPRAADLAAGYHRLAGEAAKSEARRGKLLDILYRLEKAMQDSLESLDAPDLARLDADMKILAQDLRPLEVKTVTPESLILSPWPSKNPGQARKPETQLERKLP